MAAVTEQKCVSCMTKCVLSLWAWPKDRALLLSFSLLKDDCLIEGTLQYTENQQADLLPSLLH